MLADAVRWLAAALLVGAASTWACSGLNDHDAAADADADADSDADADEGVDADEDVAPEPVETWLVHVGGPCHRYGTGLVETPEGGVMVVGYYEDESVHDRGVWVVGLGADHERRWERLLGEGEDYAAAAAPHPDDGMVVVGQSDGSGWLAQVGDDGTPRWQRRLSTYGSYLWSIAATPDDGLLLAGHIAEGDASALWVARADGAGELDWQARFSGVGGDRAAITATAEGGAIVAGQGPASRPLWTWVARLDAAGEPLWQRRIDRASGSTGHRFSVVETTDGDVALAMTAGPGILVVRLDASGALRWARSLSGDREVRGGVVAAGPERGLVVGGTESMAFTEQSYNHWTCGMDAAGEVIWEWSVPDERLGEVYAALRARDGGLVTMSGGCGDTWILKLGPDGSFGGDCGALIETAATVADETVEVVEVELAHEPTSLETAVSTPAVRESSTEATVLCTGRVGG